MSKPNKPKKPVPERTPQKQSPSEVRSTTFGMPDPGYQRMKPGRAMPKEGKSKKKDD